MMLMLGMVLLTAPQLLNNVIVAAIILILSISVTLAIVKTTKNRNN
jgi:hypothetical protein